MADNQGTGQATTTYQAWSRSYVEMYSIAHEWTIENFIELDEEATVIFRVNASSDPATVIASGVSGINLSSSSNGGGVTAAAAAGAAAATSSGSEHDLKFKLSLKPRYGENRDYISLYVHNQNKKDLKYSLVFNILDANKEKKLVRRADTRVHNPNESWGFPKFCQRSEVTDNVRDMLPEGTLTVLCEIGGFKRISNRSDFQQVREKFDREVFPDLAKDLTTSFGNMEHSDFILKCRTGEIGAEEGDENRGAEVEFPCHKFMLASRSDVFQAMFSHSMKEAVSGEVDLTSTAPAHVVQEFLRFIYTDDFQDTSFKTVSQLLPLAEKYNVRRLCVTCAQHLLEAMTVENVSEIAVIGQIYHVELLRKKAIEYISQYPERVMRTPGWQLLLKEAPDVCTSIIRRLSRCGGAAGVANVGANVAEGKDQSGGAKASTSR